MKSSIVYVSGSGNTKKLAEQIQSIIGPCEYVGKPDKQALESDMLYVGFWTMKFTCPPVIQEFLKQLDHKKVFLFGTAGYDNTQEYFDRILDSAAAHLNGSSQIVGRFMCQGRVSEGKKKMLAEADLEKFQSMKEKLAQGEQHPDQGDFDQLAALVRGI